MTEYVAPDGCTYDSAADYLWMDVLGACGCGNSEVFGQRALKVLMKFSKDWNDRGSSVYEDPVDELLAHWLDSKELIDHGTGIGASWLTEKGEALVAELSNHGTEDTQ